MSSILINFHDGNFNDGFVRNHINSGYQYGQSPGNFRKRMSSINSSAMRTYDKKSNATPRPCIWNQYNT